MGAPQLFDDLLQQGFSLSTKSGMLFVSPKERITDRHRDIIRQHKSELLETLKKRLLAILASACAGVDGITAEQMESLLNDDDRREILAGLIPAIPTLRAYAESFAWGIRSGRIVLLSREGDANV